MAKPKKRSKRRSFPGEEPRAPKKYSTAVSSEYKSGGLFGFFKDYSVRETIESFVIAILLALMFRAFEAEAFIIPTGSMAPALQGQHKDLACEECGHWYRVGVREGANLTETTCPLCQHTTKMTNEWIHSTNNGDRILVNKFIYDFKDPERFDVIVFKNPNIAKENYIKRLIGLPGDNLLIENGDIYTMEKSEDGVYDKTIARKPSTKMLHTTEIISDTEHISRDLELTGWPLPWEQRSGEENWKSDYGEGANSYQFEAEVKPEISWLSFKYNSPERKHWPIIRDKLQDKERFKSPPNFGRLINDYVTYNDVPEAKPDGTRVTNRGLHWVGDVGVEADLEIKSGSGSLFFDIVEGGAHFQVAIDSQSGELSLSAKPPENPLSDSVITFVDAEGNKIDKPTVETPVKGTGSWQVRVFNADDKIHVWVDGKLFEFPGCLYTRTDIPVPAYSEEDPADLQPISIGCQNLEVVCKRLKVSRDIYYISTTTQAFMSNESGADPDEIIATMRNPTRWNSEKSRALFSAKKDQKTPMFVLQKGKDPAKYQFLPMGDNSANSLDGRVWDGPRYFERDLMIGRAIIVFWPHTLNSPIPYLPNFGRMTFIK